jgi:hypothetical protein
MGRCRYAACILPSVDEIIAASFAMPEGARLTGRYQGGADRRWNVAIPDATSS